MDSLLRLDPKSLKGRETAVCSTFGNSGVVPILFATVLLRNHPDPSVLPLAISYISFYLLGWTPIFWTLGFNKLTGGKTAVGTAAPPPPKMLKGDTLGRIKHFIQYPPASIGRICSPPIIGSVGGLLIGISPLAKLFLGPKAPLGMLTNSLQTIGSAYTSCGLLVLAGSLALPIPQANPEDEKETAAQAALHAAAAAVAPSGRTKRKLRTDIHPGLQIASICLVRFCLCPALFLSIILRCVSNGWVKLDKLMVFVLFLQVSLHTDTDTHTHRH